MGIASGRLSLASAYAMRGHGRRWTTRRTWQRAWGGYWPREQRYALSAVGRLPRGRHYARCRMGASVGHAPAMRRPS